MSVSFIAKLAEQWAALWGKLDALSYPKDQRRINLVFEQIDSTESVVLTAKADTPAEALYQLAIVSKRVHDIEDHEVARVDIEQSCALIHAALYSIRDVLVTAAGDRAPDFSRDVFLPEYLNPHSGREEAA